MLQMKAEWEARDSQWGPSVKGMSAAVLTGEGSSTATDIIETLSKIGLDCE